VFDIELDLGCGRMLQLYGGEPWRFYVGSALLHSGFLSLGIGPWRFALCWPVGASAPATSLRTI
jgi:hypothetical protein